MSRASDLLNIFEAFDDEWDLEKLKQRQRQHQGADDEPDYEGGGISQADLERHKKAARIRALGAYNKANPDQITTDQDSLSILGKHALAPQYKRVDKGYNGPGLGAPAQPRPGLPEGAKSEGTWWKTKRSTRVFRMADGDLICQYHKTHVVTVKPSGEIILDTGGRRSNTTRDRMNDMSRYHNLGYSIYQKKYQWYVTFKGPSVSYDKQILVLNPNASESWASNLLARIAL